jgi:hypothetical protein
MTDYYLHDELIVREDESQHFERAAFEFLSHGAFRRFSPKFAYDLVLGMRTVEPFRYDPTGTAHGARAVRSRAAALASAPPREADAAPTQRVDVQSEPDETLWVHRYVNLWRIPERECLDLAAVMKLSADDDRYIALNAHVIDETQSILSRMCWREKGEVARPGQQFVRIVRRFASADLGRFVFAAGALLRLFEERGWHHCGHYGSVTGRLNTITAFWQPASRADEHVVSPESMDAIVDALPSRIRHVLGAPYAELACHEQREVLVRASYSDAQTRAIAPLAVGA